MEGHRPAPTVTETWLEAGTPSQPRQLASPSGSYRHDPFHMQKPSPASQTRTPVAMSRSPAASYQLPASHSTTCSPAHCAGLSPHADTYHGSGGPFQGVFGAANKSSAINARQPTPDCREEWPIKSPVTRTVATPSVQAWEPGTPCSEPSQHGSPAKVGLRALQPCHAGAASPESCRLESTPSHSGACVSEIERKFAEIVQRSPLSSIGSSTARLSLYGKQHLESNVGDAAQAKVHTPVLRRAEPEPPYPTSAAATPRSVERMTSGNMLKACEGMPDAERRILQEELAGWEADSQQARSNGSAAQDQAIDTRALASQRIPEEAQLELDARAAAQAALLRAAARPHDSVTLPAGSSPSSREEASNADQLLLEQASRITDEQQPAKKITAAEILDACDAARKVGVGTAKIPNASVQLQVGVVTGKVERSIPALPNPGPVSQPAAVTPGAPSPDKDSLPATKALLSQAERLPLGSVSNFREFNKDNSTKSIGEIKLLGELEHMELTLLREMRRSDTLEAEFEAKMTAEREEHARQIAALELLVKKACADNTQLSKRVAELEAVQQKVKPPLLSVGPPVGTETLPAQTDSASTGSSGSAGGSGKRGPAPFLRRPSQYMLHTNLPSQYMLSARSRSSRPAAEQYMLTARGGRRSRSTGNSRGSSSGSPDVLNPNHDSTTADSPEVSATSPGEGLSDSGEVSSGSGCEHVVEPTQAPEEEAFSAFMHYAAARSMSLPPTCDLADVSTRKETPPGSQPSVKSDGASPSSLEVKNEPSNGQSSYMLHANVFQQQIGGSRKLLKVSKASGSRSSESGRSDLSW